MPHSTPRSVLAGLALAALVASCGGTAGTAAPASTVAAGPSNAPAASASSAAAASPSASSAAAASPSASSGAAPGSSAAASAVIGPTTGGLTLVEPLRDLSAWQGSVAITPAGSLAMLQSGADVKLHALACATSCGNPATWSSTTLDPGVAYDNALIRARDDGSLVAVVDNFVAGQIGEYLGFCDAACDAGASWRWTHLPLPADSVTQRASSRYFAVAGKGMIIGLGSGTPMSALVCGGTCESPASWTRIKFSNAVCSAPSVAAGADGAMAFACDTADHNATPPMSTEVWSCPGSCTNQVNWSGVQGLASGTGLASDVTVGPGGMVGVAINLGEQANTGMANHLGWFQCTGGCGEPTSWHGIVVGTETLYVRRVAAVTDQQARTVIAYDGVSSRGNGLLTAVCVASCLTPSSWTVALLDDAKRVSGQIPVAAPPGCDSAFWMADNVTDIAMRGDWAAIASGYSAIGTGGTCTDSLYSPSTAYQPIRSVVSLAILGP